MGERCPYKAEVAGSIPVPPNFNCGVVVQPGLECRPVTPEIAGSNPVGPAIDKLQKTEERRQKSEDSRSRDSS